MNNLELSWKQWVGPIVNELPDKDMVLADLKKFLENIFKN